MTDYHTSARAERRIRALLLMRCGQVTELVDWIHSLPVDELRDTTIDLTTGLLRWFEGNTDNPKAARERLERLCGLMTHAASVIEETSTEDLDRALLEAFLADQGPWPRDGQ